MNELAHIPTIEKCIELLLDDNIGPQEHPTMGFHRDEARARMRASLGELSPSEITAAEAELSQLEDWVLETLCYGEESEQEALASEETRDVIEHLFDHL